MDDEDFDDLLAEAELLQGSSQEFLSTTVADLHLCHGDNDDDIHQSYCTPADDQSDDNSIDKAQSSLYYQQADGVGLSPTVNTTACIEDGQAATASNRASNTEGSGDSIPLEGLADDDGSLSVTEKIEKIFQMISMDLLTERNELHIMLKTRKQFVVNPVGSQDTRTADNPRPPPKLRRICFPGKNEEEAWRFSTIITFSTAGARN